MHCSAWESRCTRWVGGDAIVELCPWDALWLKYIKVQSQQMAFIQSPLLKNNHNILTNYLIFIVLQMHFCVEMRTVWWCNICTVAFDSTLISFWRGQLLWIQKYELWNSQPIFSPIHLHILKREGDLQKSPRCIFIGPKSDNVYPRWWLTQSLLLLKREWCSQVPQPTCQDPVYEWFDSGCWRCFYCYWH